MKALVWLAAYAGFLLFAMAVRLEFAYVESVLWSWFAMPRLPAVSVMEFFGLTCLIGLFTAKLPEPEKDEQSAADKATAWAAYAVLPWLVLLLAWVARALA